MANDVTDFLRQQLGQALQEALGGEEKKKSGGGLGGKGMLAGAALAAMTPVAKRGIDAYRSGEQRFAAFEVSVGGVVRNADRPRHLAQRHAGRAMLGKQLSPGCDQCPAQIAVVIGAA